MNRKPLAPSGNPPTLRSIMTVKQQVLAALQRLPEDATYEQMLETVEFMAAIQQGRDDVAAGRVVSHEEVKRQLHSWLHK